MPRFSLPSSDAGQIRSIAVAHHHEAAPEFERRYAEMRADRFASAFSYGRTLIDDEISAVLRSLPPGASVLDVGCGTGASLSLVQSHSLKAFGVEPAVAMRTAATRDHPDATRRRRNVISVAVRRRGVRLCIRDRGLSLPRSSRNKEVVLGSAPGLEARGALSLHYGQSLRARRVLGPPAGTRTIGEGGNQPRTSPLRVLLPATGGT